MRLCTICARGGSKGVPGKNIRLLSGLPLIAHTIAQAKASGVFDAIAASSDSAEILSTAQKYGADMLIERPHALAADTAGKIPAIIHAVQEAEARRQTRYDTVVDLDVTAPLRLPEDIHAAVRLLEDSGCDNVLSASPSRHSPYFNLVECDELGIVHLSKSLPGPVLRRQDSPPCYDLNGSVYVWRRDSLLHDPRLFYRTTRLYAMPRDRSVDIDDEVDFALVELILSQRKAA